MCEPVSLMAGSQLALAGASAAAGVYTAYDAAKTQGKQYEQNAQAAQDAYILQSHLTGQRMSQEQAALSQSKQDNQIKRMQGQATAKVAAAAGGVEGRSVENALRSFERNEGIISDRMSQSFENQMTQMSFQRQGLQAQTQDRIDSVGIPNMNNIYASAVRGAGSFVGAVSDFKDIYDGDFDVQ